METRQLVINGEVLVTIELPIGTSEAVWAETFARYIPTVEPEPEV